ncbi:MAG: hypothetical protein A3I73_05925 [Omnitrophica bacterium RIFCSPLOWO2_02_FULL_45_16]|nr:MAG: hypothetical protein A3C51_05630 [Omnitrophica bacterium RIFCSPHIGHO2_02_FULL_46_20]OGW94464.1 MAG: hypothetical protein A3G36_05860 [Omnitrophica bacterium RIFCSPLOWO2_12_FULL_45_13]OGW94978.1 MAG: hypothetical protein A3K16_04180 [Omnitrophica bacterium RIFCSPLOWO2_01_FULL_45_24]OGX00301.1 MAG: hypothetical protein A3I73_05925 [Omnitrophica bacterium RIFCSPLOWO2_02_FULL_45_16]
MTEKEFWVFLSKSLARGRIPQLSGYRNSDDKLVDAAGAYFGGHSVLFEGHENLAKDIIVEIGELISIPDVTLRAKEAILMILAHHPSKEALWALTKYNKNPDKGLEYTAHFALQECEWWNE